MAEDTSNIQNADLTVGAYLHGIVGFDINDDAITSLCAERDLTADSLYVNLTTKQKELLKADTYLWRCNAPTIIGSTEEANGTWKHKVGSIQSQNADKEYWRKLAWAIYRKYGEEYRIPSSSIKVNNTGMKLWRTM